MIMDLETEVKLEESLAIVLAKVYMQIPWNKVNVKSAHKFFIDRIRASSNARNFKEFLDVLTRKVNVTFVKIDYSLMDLLNKYNDFVMMLVRKESLYITNYALEKVDEFKN